MYQLLNSLLSDKKGGEVFLCFEIWHFLFIALTASVLAIVFCLLHKKSNEQKNRTTRTFINIAFGLYVADFFLMPFAYGEIDIEKLPFHICTVSCVLCFLSRHIKALEKYRVNIAMLAFISNLIYLIYPAGVMWHQVHPLSYRVIQTLLFHSIMTMYGLLVLVFDNQNLKWKYIHRDLALMSIITLWAVLGNILYNGEAGKYKHFFNWFFVVRDPFYIIPEDIARYIMPLINIFLFMFVETIIHIISNIFRKNQHKCKL